MCFKHCILPKHSDIAMYMCVCFKEHVQVQVYFLSDSVTKHGYFMCIVKRKLSWSDLTVAWSDLTVTVTS